MKIAVLTIGDEICMGQVVNSNAAWIAYECSKLGCDVTTHSSIGDEEGIIISELGRLLALNDAVLITGGLGPTPDDLTKPALAKFFGDTLEFHQPTLESLTKRYLKRGIKITEGNKSIALLPQKCTLLDNSVGTAPGMLFIGNGKTVVSMPGVPAEMKAIMSGHVLPYIKELLNKSGSPVKLFKTLQTIGIAESLLAELIGDVSEFIGSSSLAYLPSYRGVRLRINSHGPDISEAEAELERIAAIISQRAGKYIFGGEGDTISRVVGDLLKTKGLTVSVAESCTGGMLGAAFTDNPGSSAYFAGGVITYSNEVKIRLLGVKESTIADYGAVSRETAIEMAANVRAKFDTDFGISITGIAGPDGGTETKPVGTVWIGLADKENSIAEKFLFGRNRSVNREFSVGYALNMLYQRLRGNVRN